MKMEKEMEMRLSVNVSEVGDLCCPSRSLIHVQLLLV